jgi:thiamine pyrophosphokinase
MPAEECTPRLNEPAQGRNHSTTPITNFLFRRSFDRRRIFVLRAVIFANGQLNGLVKLQPDDLIIAADGGAQHCLKLGILPQVVIGDFDSIEAGELETLQAQGAEIVAFPARKDYTDLELALLEARQRGADQVVLLAALGRRWDQSLANLLLPAAFPGLRISLVDGLQEISFIRPGEVLEITGLPGDTVSLVPMGGDAEGITTHGLEYPLRAETLRLGSTRGISNLLLPQVPGAGRASVTLKAGLLLCAVIHQAEE